MTTNIETNINAGTDTTSTDRPYFIAADLHDLPVLVVGAGRVATRKVHDLLAAGARITVIAPHATDDLRDLAAADRIEWLPRDWRWTDIGRPAALIFAATDDAVLNARIHTQGRRIGKLVNTASAGSRRSFSTPAVAHGNGVSVAISTNGANVLRALQWRDRIARLLPSNDASHNTTDALQALQAHGLPPVGPKAGELPTSSSSSTHTQSGTVTLVGAGPGDPDLLTLGGLRAIERADVIVHDNLVSPDLLDYARPDALRIDVGKDPFGRVVRQDEIHRILLEHARAGRNVVRLKGGDPFIFGRGTEEIEVLAEAGIRFRLIPGVTSLTGVLGAAGVAVTRRGRNHGFAVFSAADPTPDADFTQWAATPGPLVIFMGVRRAAQIAAGLIAGGRRSDEPVVVVARGGTPRQQVEETTLGQLGELLADAAAWTPTLIVVGVEREAAFAARPLDGVPVAVAGRLDDAHADALRADGAIVARAVASEPGHPFAAELLREGVSESRRLRAAVGLAV